MVHTAQTIALERMKAALNAVQSTVTDIERYIQDFQRCDNDQDRARILGFLIHTLSTSNSPRLDLLALSLGELAIESTKD